MLHSDWLIRMLDKHPSRQPLLALFDILDDWTSAPLIRLDAENAASGVEDASRLLDYLAAQADAGGYQHPQSIATQIYLIALGALHQQIRSPGCGALQNARQAAAVLLDSQRTKRPPVRRLGLATAASTVIAIAGLSLAMQLDLDAPPAAQHSEVAQTSPVKLKPASPLQVAALYNRIERMRGGICNYPQALMLPPEQRALYLEGVVGGAFPVDRADPKDLLELVNKVECYYPPAIMTAS